MTPQQNADATTIPREILRASRGGAPVVTCTVIVAPEHDAASPRAGDKLLVFSDGRALGGLGGGPLEAAIVDLAVDAISQHVVQTFAFSLAGERIVGRAAARAAPEVVEVLLEVIEAPATLLVVGGGHVGRSLGEIGALLGMRVAVLDDRAEYASRERFPFADTVICGDFAEELDRFPIDANTYVVLVSRGHKVDELSLRHVAERGAAYLGMIGSRRRTRTVLEHLRAEGVPAEALARVFTPIGLDIGAETPAEIALAVLAEIVLTRREGSGRPLSTYGREVAAD